MTHQIARFGWLPDLPDHRDLTYQAPRTVVTKLPAKKDLRSGCPMVYDQGQLGSCTANAIAGSYEFELIKQSNGKDFTPSRLFIYYNERVIEHTVESDSGAMLRDGMKSVNLQGVCPEKMWPYIPEKFADRPLGSCFTDARNRQVLSYHRVSRNLNQMKGCIAEGYPFVLGFTVYESFESEVVAKTGKLPMPKIDEKELGGHAVMAVGYDDKIKRFIIRNSWGSSWGMSGYFTMPYVYLMDENLSDDFWTIRLVETQQTKVVQKKK